MCLNIGKFYCSCTLVALFCLLFSTTSTDASEFETRSISVKTVSQEIRLLVEVADNQSLRNRGLMYREMLEPMSGMLFDFNKPTPVFMWMKNTPLSLDMLFIDEQGKILYIKENTIPGSLDTISASQPVRAVLEVAAGFALRHEIRIGDTVKDIIFSNY
ncbi:DUF192 domain-containing protein [Sneathiella sp.]|uniref:DUF192 domain-containing protein n=1 Tax=Sneathiella sp. TaxID=1964365 RepID=UPI003FA74569